MAGKIFVNYRRQDARADARSIHYRLVAAFGKANVFMDVDNLRPGQQFGQELETALEQCDVFLPIIGPRWLDLLNARSESGQRDYVRDEIAGALGRGIMVIPILVDGATLPRPDELPHDLRAVVSHQSHTLTHERFGRDLGDLVDAIKERRPSKGSRYRGTIWLSVLGVLALAAIVSGYIQGPAAWFRVLNQHVDTSSLRAGQTFRDCPDCPEMVVVPAGEFTMGSPEDEPGRAPSEGPQHKVRITRPFAVGKYEVMVKEYEAFVVAVRSPPDGGCNVWTAYGHRFEKDRSFRSPAFAQTPSHPVVCMSWQAARTYVNWLTTKTGRKYRLLSEAEWEYAARANSTTRYYFGDDEAKLCDYGNGADRTSAFLWGNHLCSDGVGVQTAETGKYRPNAFGLHDMIGNVSELVDDCVHPNYVGAPTDGSAWMSGDCTNRVIRGGSWDNDVKALRSAARGGYNMQGKDNIGFRIARDLD
jgi:formylglycine-generating enzyme required for sulfatase activity